jgi:hypothetical protein
MSATDILQLGSRMTGAMCLDAGTYEDVEGDRRATWQALIVVVLASVAAGIGFPPHGEASLRVLAMQSAGALLGWFAWSALVYLLGVHVFPGPATHSSLGELLRTTGFSTAPGILLAFGILPVIGGPLFVLTTVWMMATMLMAVRQALDYTSVARAAAVCAASWLLAFLSFVILGLVSAPPVF